MAGRGTVGPGRNEDRDLVGGVFGEPDGAVASGRDTGGPAPGRRHEVVVRPAVVGKDASDTAALRIGEPHRTIARYSQSLGKAVLVQFHLLERAAELHQSQHRSTVLGEPDTAGAGSDRV